MVDKMRSGILSVQELTRTLSVLHSITDYVHLE